MSADGTDNALIEEVEALRQRVADLESQNRDLELLLETTTEHSDTITADLEQDKADLEVLLETTTEHSDAVEEELHDRAEEAVRESERRLRLIVETTPVPVFICKARNSEIVYANQLLGPSLGTTSEALLGQSINQFVVDKADEQRIVDVLTDEGEISNLVIRIKTLDGRVRWIDVSLRQLRLEGRARVLGAWNDITELIHINDASSRFVPTRLLAFLRHESIVSVALGDHVSEVMSVMFSDLRAYTSISETMTARQNFDFVNAYFDRVCPVMEDHGGFIVKYLGDGMMSIFPRRANDAVDAGLAKLGKVNEYNAQRVSLGREPIQIGIGINTGSMMVGFVGHQGRLQGDAISDSVNLASRVESLTKFYGVSFLITEATYQGLERPEQYDIRFVDRVQVVGKSEAPAIYEVFGGDIDEQVQLKRETLDEYQEAMDALYDHRFADAQALLFSVLKVNPSDKVAWRHLLEATRLLESDDVEDWKGARVMRDK
ncbi:MAG: adenylate/guanylate cyclase domain-containing protein [Pseudomonadota bacterium]